MPDLLLVILLEIGSIEGAKKAIDAGVDGIIVQGREAGGHVIGQVNIPVIILSNMYILSI